MDIPKNPAALGVRGLTAYLSGITREQLQKERDEVIDTDAKEIRALVPYAKAVLSNNCLCVVGNENNLIVSYILSRNISTKELIIFERK